MMKLIIADKISIAKRIHSARVFGDGNDVIVTFGFGHWQYKIPKLKMYQIPYTEEPSKMELRFPKLSSMNSKCFARVEKSRFQMESLCIDGALEIINKKISYYDEIIVCADCDGTGMYSAMQIIERLDNKETPITTLNMMGYDEKSIQQAWKKRGINIWSDSGLGFGKKLALQHTVKKYFDYWWYCNSALVLNELMQTLGINTDKLMSKYELMLIMMIFQNKDFYLPNILKQMERWLGTGKYKLSNYEEGIGSPASRSQIIQNAIDRGVIEDAGENKVTMSDKGIKFISYLHPKTFDPDLPFRLGMWIEAMDTDKPKAYISRVFGRQLRHQRSLFKKNGIC